MIPQNRIAATGKRQKARIVRVCDFTVEELPFQIFHGHEDNFCKKTTSTDSMAKKHFEIYRVVFKVIMRYTPIPLAKLLDLALFRPNIQKFAKNRKRLHQLSGQRQQEFKAVTYYAEYSLQEPATQSPHHPSAEQTRSERLLTDKKI